MFSKASKVVFWVSISRPEKEIIVPADRSLVSGSKVPTGNLRLSSPCIISSPTAPVAPTTATFIGFCSLFTVLRTPLAERNRSPMCVVTNQSTFSSNRYFFFFFGLDFGVCFFRMEDALFVFGLLFALGLVRTDLDGAAFFFSFSSEEDSPPLAASFAVVTAALELALSTASTGFFEPSVLTLFLTGSGPWFDWLFIVGRGCGDTLGNEPRLSERGSRQVQREQPLLTLRRWASFLLSSTGSDW